MSQVRSLLWARLVPDAPVKEIPFGLPETRLTGTVVSMLPISVSLVSGRKTPAERLPVMGKCQDSGLGLAAGESLW